MKGDPELEIYDDSPQDRKDVMGRGFRTDGHKRFPALLGIMLFLVFAVGVFYFITNRPTARDTKGEETLVSRIAALEEKVTGLEVQVTELQGKSSKGPTDPFLLSRVEALSKKVEALETRGAQRGDESRIKTSPSKPTVQAQKKYHTVQRGETLIKIGKRYGIAVEDLRKLNNLSKGQPIQVGQKLLVSVKP